MNQQRRDELIDVLGDVAHDLGKQLLRQVTLWPPGHNFEAIRNAVKSRFEGEDDKPTPDSIWLEIEKSSPELTSIDSEYSIREAVEKALGWQQRITGSDASDRQALTDDFAAVAQRCRAVAAQLRQGGSQ